MIAMKNSPNTVCVAPTIAPDYTGASARILAKPKKVATTNVKILGEFNPTASSMDTLARRLCHEWHPNTGITFQYNHKDRNAPSTIRIKIKEEAKSGFMGLICAGLQYKYVIDLNNHSVQNSQCIISLLDPGIFGTFFFKLYAAIHKIFSGLRLVEPIPYNTLAGAHLDVGRCFGDEDGPKKNIRARSAHYYK